MTTLSSQLVLTLRDRVTGPARGVGRALGAMQRDVRGFNATSTAMAAGIGRSARNLALLGAGYLGVGVGVGGALRAAMNFEDAMAGVQKTSGMTATQLAAMEQTITGLSNAMPLTRVELANLVAQAAQFGVANEDLDEFALLAAKASVAFDMSATDTSSSLSVLMNSYGLTIEQLGLLSDAINSTADSAGASESQVIDFLSRVGPTATQFGISAEQMTAYGASLIEMGISAERSATGMNAMMVKLSSLTENEDAVAILDRIGGEGYSERLQRKFFEAPVDAMQELFELSKRMTTEQRSGFFLEMFGLEYGDDAAAIASAIDTIVERQEDLADSTRHAGSVQRTYDTYVATASQKLRVLANNLTNLGAAFGARFLPGIVNFSERLVATLGTLDERVTVFDELGAGVRGFFDGLADGMGLESGDLGRFLDEGWAFIFGDPAQFEADTENLARIFYRMSEWGEPIGKVAKFLGGLTKRIDEFLGLDVGTAGAMLSDIGTTGLTLALGAVGIGLAASVIGKLAAALYFLSGAKAAVGLLRAVAGAGGAFGAWTALGGLAGRPGRAPPGGRGLLSRLGLPAVGGYLMSRQSPEMDAYGTAIDARVREQIEASTRSPVTADTARLFQTLNSRGGVGSLAAESFSRVREEAEGATESTGQLGDELGEVGAMEVSPNVDSAPINRALAATQRLRFYLDGIDTSSQVTSAPTVGFRGGRASGGPVGPGIWRVGERGEELLALNGRGHVFNNQDTRSILDGLDVAGIAGRSSAAGHQAAAGQAMRPIVNTFNITISGAGQMGPDELSRALAREMQQALRSHYADTA